jgi:hypothetical protein
VVLYRKDEESDVRLSLEGAAYALSILKAEKSTKPTPKTRKLADSVIASFPPETPTFATLRAMADVAVSWRDLDMWTKIVQHNGVSHDLRVLDKDRLHAAVVEFSFEAVCPM